MNDYLFLGFIGLSLILLCDQAPLNPSNDVGWNSFLTKNNKSYHNSNEELVRYQRWKNCTIEAELFNSQNHSYTKTCYYFADWMQEEIDLKLKGYRPPNSSQNFSIDVDSIDGKFQIVSKRDDAFPASIDWREKGYVTPVKMQGQCGSCWSFAATGALEGAYFKKTGKLVSLSEQQFVDCDAANYACRGGYPSSAFSYAISAGGINTETAYPYVSGRTLAKESCKFTKNKALAQPITYKYVPNNDENTLLSTLVAVGPIAVTICADNNFHNYQRGLYFNTACKTPNHAVLLVGFGTDSKYGKYWIIKNSWANYWGEKGYIRMQIGKNLIKDGVYPIF